MDYKDIGHTVKEVLYLDDERMIFRDLFGKLWVGRFAMKSLERELPLCYAHEKVFTHCNRLGLNVSDQA